MSVIIKSVHLDLESWTIGNGVDCKYNGVDIFCHFNSCISINFYQTQCPLVIYTVIIGSHQSPGIRGSSVEVVNLHRFMSGWETTG